MAAPIDKPVRHYTKRCGKCSMKIYPHWQYCASCGEKIEWPLMVMDDTRDMSEMEEEYE